MVKSLFILTGLLFSLAQPPAIEQSNFKLENKEVFYERVFEVENTSPEELVKIIENHLKTISSIENINTSQNTINAQSNKTLIDYKKYGEKSMSTWRVLNCPTASKITIQVAPNKYTLLIRDIEFSCSLPQPTTYTLNRKTTKKGMEFKDSKIITDGLIYLDKYFTDEFDVTKK